MNVSHKRRLSEIEDEAHRVSTEARQAVLALPKHPGRRGKLSHMTGTVRVATAPGQDVQIHNVELLSGRLPPGLVAGSTDPDGQYACRNIFSQAYNVGDVVVSFESIGVNPAVPGAQGLSGLSAGELAGLSATQLAGMPAAPSGTPSSPQWWAFKPGAGQALGYFELTQAKPLAVVYATAKPVQADGNIDPTADDVYLVDDDGEATRFWGLPAYTDADQAAAVHKGYRYFATFLTDDWKNTGIPAYRIVDGEGPLRTIAVRIVGGPVQDRTTAINVTPLDADARRARGNPDNGRFPRITGEVGTGTDPYFGAIDFDNVAQGAKNGEHWLVEFHEQKGVYLFRRRINANYIEIRGKCVAGVARSASTFLLEEIEVLRGNDPRADPTSAVERITIRNEPPIQCGANTSGLRAVWDDNGGRWVVDGANAQYICAATGRGLTTAAVASTDTSFSINTVGFRQGHDPSIVNAASTLSVNNGMKWDLNQGALVYFEEDLNDAAPPRYDAIQAECP